MKILVCPDSFKGSLSAEEAADIMAEEILKFNSSIEVLKIPLADGGEGTAERIKDFYDTRVKLKVSNPIGKDIEVEVLVTTHSDRNKKCFLESAKIIGLPLLPIWARNPLLTTSYGLGEAIKAMVKKGYEDIKVSLGGSSTCDGGMGMLEALGFVFYDESGKELRGNGGNLKKICRIDDSKVDINLRSIKFSVLCDVTNPLLGNEGAAKVYSPQKGAFPRDVEILEEGMANYFRVCHKEGYCEKNHSIISGAGAAGGLGFAFSSFLGAALLQGIDYILDLYDFNNIMEGVDLVITGEGSVDSQSLMGKVLSGVLEKAKKRGKEICIVAGKIKNREELLSKGVFRLYEAADQTLTHEGNMNKNQAKINLGRAMRALLKDSWVK